MMPAHPHSWLIISASFAAALAITLFPVPVLLAPLRPDWTTLVLIYWIIALPHRVGVGTGWVVGMFQDAATGTLLGQQALGMTVVAYLVLLLYQRIRNYPVWQQAIIVMIFIALACWSGRWCFWFCATSGGAIMWSEPDGGRIPVTTP